MALADNPTAAMVSDRVIGHHGSGAKKVAFYMGATLNLENMYEWLSMLRNVECWYML